MHVGVKVLVLSVFGQWEVVEVISASFLVQYKIGASLFDHTASTIKGDLGMWDEVGLKKLELVIKKIPDV